LHKCDNSVILSDAVLLLINEAAETEGGGERNKKFWKELICLLSLHCLKMSFALKPAFAPT
jgi:hypothetical protein